MNPDADGLRTWGPHRGTPRLNTIDDRGTARMQTPVYATEAEAMVSGSGWLYWIDTPVMHADARAFVGDPS